MVELNRKEQARDDGADDPWIVRKPEKENRALRKARESGQSSILLVIGMVFAVFLVLTVFPLDSRADLLVDGTYEREVTVKESFASRAIGLLTARSENAACLLEGTSSIHCIGMSWPIDVVYLYEGNVVYIETVKPGNLGASGVPADSVLELPAGQAAAFGLTEGAKVEFAGHRS